MPWIFRCPRRTPGVWCGSNSMMDEGNWISATLDWPNDMWWPQEYFWTRTHPSWTHAWAPCSTKDIPLPLYPTDKAIMAQGFAVRLIPSPCSGSYVTMLPGSTSDAASSSFSTEDITPPPLCAEDIPLWCVRCNHLVHYMEIFAPPLPHGRCRSCICLLSPFLTLLFWLCFNLALAVCMQRCYCVRRQFNKHSSK